MPGGLTRRRVRRTFDARSGGMHTMAESEGFSPSLSVTPPKKRYVVFFDAANKTSWILLKVDMLAESDVTRNLIDSLQATLAAVNYPERGRETLIKQILQTKVPELDLKTKPYEEPQPEGPRSFLSRTRDWDLWLPMSVLDATWLGEQSKIFGSGTYPGDYNRKTYPLKGLSAAKVLTLMDTTRFPNQFDKSKAKTYGSYNIDSLNYLQNNKDFQKKGFDSSFRVVDSKQTDFKGTAHLTVVSAMTDTHLNLKLSFDCSPKYMCRPYDLVPLQLVATSPHNSSGKIVLNLGVIQATKKLNHFEIEVKLSWTHLISLLTPEIGRRKRKDWQERTEKAKKEGTALPAPLPETAPTKADLIQWVPELGVLARWMAFTVDDKNGENHTSGGMDQKGGSGKIRFRQVASQELAATEVIRIAEWNAGELLTPDRQVHRTFGAILQTGENKDFATTLEAEAELLVPDDKQLARDVIDKMKALQAEVEQAKKENRKSGKFGILDMEPLKSKTYTDTYFDVVPKDGANDAKYKHMFLRCGIVLRRRSVPTDEPGTYLFSVKGRSVAELDNKGAQTGEFIRLASQLQLIEAQVRGTEGAALLRRFIGDASTDNPFGRTVVDALEHRENGADLVAFLRRTDEWELQPVLTIESTRHKTLMKLEGSTAIDFSADEATGSANGRTGTVRSFEFGVGHPALVASATGGAPGSSISPSAMLARDKMSQLDLAVTRPYHVPRDLDNPALFKKFDYGQFKGLRDAIVKDLFKFSGLTRGGNKSQKLGIATGLITEQQIIPPAQAPVETPQPSTKTGGTTGQQVVLKSTPKKDGPKTEETKPVEQSTAPKGKLVLNRWKHGS